MRARAAVLLALLLLAGCGGAAPGPPTPLPETGAPLPTRVATPTGGPLPPATALPATRAPAQAPSAPTGPPDWTFSVVGDTWKDTPMLHEIFRQAVAAGDAFLVDLGDLTPQGRPEQLAEFASAAQGAGLPVYAVPGNHDVAWSQTTAPFEQFWPRHQGFDHLNAHLTIVDDSAETLSPDELAWVGSDLAATAQPLKFVFLHVPPVMPVPVPAESALQAGGPAFEALMQRYAVSTVFAGHLHAYMTVTSGGIPYVITGGGGEPLHVPGFLGGRYHYVRVSIRGDQATTAPVWLDGIPTPAP